MLLWHQGQAVVKLTVPINVCSEFQGVLLLKISIPIEGVQEQLEKINCSD